MKFDILFNAHDEARVIVLRMAADVSAAEYDLTHKIGGYLDRHLVLPILEFLSEHGVSPYSLSEKVLVSAVISDIR